MESCSTSNIESIVIDTGAIGPSKGTSAESSGKEAALSAAQPTRGPSSGASGPGQEPSKHEACAEIAKDQYDEIASAYAESKEHPWRVHAERHSMRASIRELAGASGDGSFEALDVACGSGVYTRLLAEMGASRAIGVDISPEMVKEALSHAGDLATKSCDLPAKESKTSTAVEYACGDAADLADKTSELAKTVMSRGQFDLVTATFLFNYAPDEGALRRMVKGVFAALWPGGHLLALNNNPFDDVPSMFRDLSSQCIRKQVQDCGAASLPAADGGAAADSSLSIDAADAAAGSSGGEGSLSVGSDEIDSGAPAHAEGKAAAAGESRSTGFSGLSPGDEITWTLLDSPHGTAMGSFTNYWLPPSLMERVLVEEGFTNVRWMPLDAAEGHEELLEHWGGPVRRGAEEGEGMHASAGGTRVAGVEDSVCPVVRLVARKPEV